jgi:hypothetical protein
VVASFAVSDFVESTQRSGPAPSGSVKSAVRHRLEPSTFVSAAICAPRPRATRTASSTSIVSPLCDSAMSRVRGPMKRIRCSISFAFATLTRCAATRANVCCAESAAWLALPQPIMNTSPAASIRRASSSIGADTLRAIARSRPGCSRISFVM